MVTWKKLQDKFERKSKAEYEAAQMELLNFQQREPKTTERFQGVYESCQQQNVHTPNELLQRMLLARPNGRYLTLKKIFQRSKDTQDLEEIFSAMRDDDANFQATNGSPRPGLAAFAKAVATEVQKA